MKVVRVDCRFVMPKLGQSKRKVRDLMEKAVNMGLKKHTYMLAKALRIINVHRRNTDISEALPDAEGKRRSKADAWAEGNSKSKAKAEAVCCGKI